MMRKLTIPALALTALLVVLTLSAFGPTAASSSAQVEPTSPTLTNPTIMPPRSVALADG
jgi:hypothetical protein